MNTMTKMLTAGLAFLVVGLASTNAMAADSGTPRMTVKYSGLNLSSEAGAEALYSRIQQAAFNVCGGRDSSLPWSSITRSKCYQTAIDNAVLQVNAPLLTAVHQDSTTRIASK